MAAPSYMRSVVDRNVVMRRIHTNVYIYIYVCVCVCVCVYAPLVTFQQASSSRITQFVPTLSIQTRDPQTRKHKLTIEFYLEPIEKSSHHQTFQDQF